MNLPRPPTSSIARACRSPGTRARRCPSGPSRPRSSSTDRRDRRPVALRPLRRPGRALARPPGPVPRVPDRRLMVHSSLAGPAPQRWTEP
jgi:hypothetical protein